MHLFPLLSLVLFIASVNSECPKIMSRKEWGAREPINPPVILNKVVNYTVIHHASRPRCFTKEDCISAVKSYQDLHMDKNKWDDIGYTFVVGEDGNIYEGRGWDTLGSHSVPFNRYSIGKDFREDLFIMEENFRVDYITLKGICIAGDFVTELPNELALNAVRKLIECSIEKGYLSANYTLKGHRDQSQFGYPVLDCPGEALYQEIMKWPHFA